MGWKRGTARTSAESSFGLIKRPRAAALQSNKEGGWKMTKQLGIIALAVGVMTLASCAGLERVAEQMPEEPSYKVVYDLGDAISDAQKQEYMVAEAQECRSAGAIRKGIFLHPKSDKDATITYKLAIPKTKEDERLFLIAWTSVNSDVADKTDNPWNGVRFIIRVNGQDKLNRDQMPGGWIPAVIPLDDAAGTDAEIQLATNAIDGNGSYDWSYYGQPQIVLIRPKPLGAGGELEGLTGLVFAPVASASTGSAITIQPVDASGAGIGDPVKAALPAAPGSEWTVAEYDLSKVEGVMGAKIADAASLPAGILFSPYSSDIEVSGPYQGNIQVHAGNELPITVVLKNRGMGTWIPRDGKYCVTLDGEEKVLTKFEPVRAGEEKVLRIQVTPQKTGRRAFSVELTAKGIKTFRSDGVIHVDESPAILAETRKPGKLVEAAEDRAVIQTDKVRMAALRLDAERCRLWFQRADGGKWRTVAVQPFAADVAIEEGGKAAQCVGENVGFSVGKHEGKEVLIISAGVISPSGTRMGAKSYYAAPTDNALHVVSVLEAPAGTKVLRFCGASLRVCDRPGGERKLGALFPGLEYLGPNEPSSSTRDAAPPINNRLCPDRLKVTMPLMAVNTEDGLVSLTWDADHKWDGQNVSPAAVFASPNIAERADNHLLELYLPPPVEFGADNKRTATKGCVVPESGKLSIRCRIVISEPADVLAAVDDYLAQSGLPAPQKRPHDIQKTYRLSRLGFMKSCWDEKEQKSMHCVGWPTANSPHFALLLWINSRLADKSEEKRLSLERAELIIRNTLRDGGGAGLNSGHGCHILWGIMPFYTGHMKDALEEQIIHADGMMAGQKDDGSWVFIPPTESHATLGKSGDAVQGICANTSFRLLRIARLTGYQKALEGGLKGLAFHNSKFRIPHGAQGWECPIYQPDVLGSAYGVAANLEAFMLTDKKEYLDAAIYWARTGIPFHYMWQDPATPDWMLYAGIPVFGTTFYTHSWLGMPVQWCSLVYCYHVLHMADYDKSFPWKQFVDGITVSGEWQQVGEDDQALVGSYPDSLGKRMTVRNPAFINPEDVYLNRISLEGHDPEIQSKFLRGSKFGDVVVNTCSRLKDAQIGETGLSAQIGFWQGESSGTAVLNVPKPKSVSFAGETLSEASDLSKVSSGWTHVEGRKWLLIRCRHARPEACELKVEW